MGIIRACILSLFAGISLVAGAQHAYIVKTGRLSRPLLQNHQQFKQWFGKEYTTYTPNTTAINTLKQSLANTRIIIIMGTWCSDSQREVPRLLKILDSAGVNSDSITIIGVNRHKTTPANVVKAYGITRVPTIIVLHASGAELGRIVEAPGKLLEEDLVTITRKE